MPKVIGCINCGYRSEVKSEIDLFITNGCKCQQDYSCGACGEICELQDGIVSINAGLIEFTHNSDLCPAQDEIAEAK
jgi:hypothetical protein